MFPPFNLPESIVLLITDELSSPADFALHQSLALHYKEHKNAHRIILSVSESLVKWQTIAAKSNWNFSQDIKSELSHIDFLSLAKAADEAGPPFRPICNKVAQILDSSDAAPAAIVVLDDIASLEWIGYSTPHLIAFCRALRALCLKYQATLLIRHHIVTPGEPDQLFRLLSQLCTYHMDVKPLSSGRSGAVSGEIAVHAGPSSISLPASAKLISRSSAMQYRLTDYNASFFERGSSRGVL